MKSVIATCSLEAHYSTENGSRTTSSFSATCRISKYYVMLEFNFHFSVLNFHCEGLFASSCFQFITLLLQNVSLKVADPVNVGKGRGKPTWQDMKLIYGVIRRLHLPSLLYHSFIPHLFIPVFSLIFFFLFCAPFTFPSPCLSPSPSSFYDSFMYNPLFPTLLILFFESQDSFPFSSRTHSRLPPTHLTVFGLLIFLSLFIIVLLIFNFGLDYKRGWF